MCQGMRKIIGLYDSRYSLPGELRQNVPSSHRHPGCGQAVATNAASAAHAEGSLVESATMHSCAIALA